MQLKLSLSLLMHQRTPLIIAGDFCQVFGYIHSGQVKYMHT